MSVGHCWQLWPSLKGRSCAAGKDGVGQFSPAQATGRALRIVMSPSAGPAALSSYWLVSYCLLSAFLALLLTPPLASTAQMQATSSCCRFVLISSTIFSSRSSKLAVDGRFNRPRFLPQITTYGQVVYRGGGEGGGGGGELLEVDKASRVQRGSSTTRALICHIYEQC